MNFVARLSEYILKHPTAGAYAEAKRINDEIDALRKAKGRTATPENSLKHLYNRMHVDPDLRAAILHIRHMDKTDSRIKVIHKRIARDVTKGGLQLKWKGKENKRVQKLWQDFAKRLKLDNRSKLHSDARGAAMEGNLPVQWVLTDDRHVLRGVRMPTETIVPKININGHFEDLQQAYKQIDPLTWKELATFPLWQLTVVRLEPDNFDDMGCLGRPYLDASREVWQKLVMTEEDLVIRRHHRAPQKLAHILEGATKDELKEYKEQTEAHAGEIQTDFYMNKKGSVNAISGDSALDQIADVAYLLDTFFAGSPAPKGLFGYVGDLSRDVLEDLKADYYQEIDGLQDLIAQAYVEGFSLELLLQGLNSDAYDFEICFAERRTETRNQRADLALKWQALGLPQDIVWESAGIDVSRARVKEKEESNFNNPYPEESATPIVKVTPNNAPKGESATSITTRS